VEALYQKAKKGAQRRVPCSRLWSHVMPDPTQSVEQVLLTPPALPLPDEQWHEVLRYLLALLRDQFAIDFREVDYWSRTDFASLRIAGIASTPGLALAWGGILTSSVVDGAIVSTVLLFPYLLRKRVHPDTTRSYLQSHYDPKCPRGAWSVPVWKGDQYKEYTFEYSMFFSEST
jgi:hypothetical protein